MRNDGLEVFASTACDADNNLPKGLSRCFVIGSWGGCGVSCPAFIDGECKVPEEIALADIIYEHGEEQGHEIASQYSCFGNQEQEQP